MSNIIGISRHRMESDGNGITTLVGFYGCPLECKYCINSHCNAEDTIRAAYTPEELLEVLAIDEPYFLMTGGGITFGGGEPLLNSEYIHEVCKKMNPRWKRNIETSLNVPWAKVQTIIKDIDDWYIDVKDFNKETYIKYTGRDNELMLKNLAKLLETVSPEKICLRVPFIPNYNSISRQNEEVRYIKERYGEGIRIEVFNYLKYNGEDR